METSFKALEVGIHIGKLEVFNPTSSGLTDLEVVSHIQNQDLGSNKQRRQELFILETETTVIYQVEGKRPGVPGWLTR